MRGVILSDSETFANCFSHLQMATSETKLKILNFFQRLDFFQKGSDLGLDLILRVYPKIKICLSTRGKKELGIYSS